MTDRFTVAVEGGELCGECRNNSSVDLILIHGMGGSRADWSRVRAALPAHWNVLSYDLRGFGQSRAEEGVAFSHADDLRALMDARGIDSTRVAGVSMGGAIALDFALTHPERVSHLTLVSPALVGWEWSDEWKALWRDVANAARSGDMALARERWWNHPMFAIVRASDAAAELRRSIEAYHGRQWFHDDQRAELPDIERLHELAVPTLLLTGEKDVTDMRLIADVIENAAPGTVRIDYPGAGHVLHLERPDDVARAIAAHAVSV